jgi:hypothetical protein
LAILRNGPNPGIGHLHRSPGGHGERGRNGLSNRRGLRTRGAIVPACTLQLRERVQRFEEVSRDGGVVPKVGLPVLRWQGHEADGDRVVRVQVLRAIFDDVAGAVALGRCGDSQDSGLDTTRAEAAPMRMRQAQDEGIFGGIARLEGVTKAAEDFFVLTAVFFREDCDGDGCESAGFAGSKHAFSF